MEISVFKEGRDANEDPVRLYFEAAPAVGEVVELDGELLTVSQAWHQPDDRCVGPKFAILLRRQSGMKAA